tara:strand:+ start:5679 stop:6065 length:387 start_codon:yes stop_codon:yes gene_type:complete
MKRDFSTIIMKVNDLAHHDVECLDVAEKSYGDSWKQRGGMGAFMMLARKWDRIENQVKKENYDIFETILKDYREEGALDDIRDLRRYLLLVEAEMLLYFDEVQAKKKQVAIGNTVNDSSLFEKRVPKN